jgi:hypothetical protein
MAARAGAIASPKLLDRLRRELRARHYSRRTEEAYGRGAPRSKRRP